jgi:hypothetical protein
MIQRNKKSKSTCFYIVKFGLFIVMSLTLGPLIAAQEKVSNELLPELSSVERKQFIERLNQYLQLDKEKRWSELFEFSMDLPTKGEKYRTTFVEVRNARAGATYSIDFVPATSGIINMFEDSRIWLVEGCGNLTKGAETVKVRYGVNAMLHKGIWYFDDLATLTKGVGGEYLSCC